MPCKDCPMLNDSRHVAQNPFAQKNQQRASTPHDSTDDRGYLAVGKVIAVHPKRYTVDVELFNESTSFTSNNAFEGRRAPKIGVTTAGFSNKYSAPYGEIQPIYRGDVVLLGFLKNDSHHPVIIRVFHDISEDVGVPNYRNILPNTDTKDTDITDYLKITPIQDFHKVDKDGNFEISSHTKSFFIGQETNFDEENFDYEDLSVKSPVDKSVIPAIGGYSGLTPTYDISDAVTKNAAMQTVQVAEKYSKPKKYMAVFRDAFKDTATNWLRVIADAKNTVLKIIKSQQKANRSTCIELDKDGGTSVKRQLDTRVIKGNGTKIFSKITMDATGKITIETIDKTKKVSTSTSTVSTDIATGDSDSTVASSQADNIKENNINGLATKKTEAPFELSASDATTVSATIGTNSTGTTTTSSYIAPRVEDIQLFKFPAQTFDMLRFSETPTDTSVTSSNDNSPTDSETGAGEAPTASENDSGTTVAESDTTTDTTTDPTNDSGTTTTDTTVVDASESVKNGETAQTIITIDPRGGTISIKTTSALSIDALKGISLKSDDGAISISAKKGIKMTSSEGYFYTKVKKQMVLQNDNASIGATKDGSITNKNKMGAMNIAASGEGQIGNMLGSTKFGIGGNISTFGAKIANAAPSICATGSQKNMGGITSIGSLNQIGRMTVNGRPGVVAGDRDSHGYRNFALFSSFVVSMITQFAINQVVGRVAASLPKAAMLLAVIDLCAGGFAAMKEAGWKGMASCLEDAAKGAIIDVNSPFHGMLVDYCNKHGYGSVLSVAAQVQFLTDPEPPGMGMCVTEALESIGYDYLEEKAAAWGGAAVLWTAIGSPNGMKDLAGEVVKNMAGKVEKTLQPESLMTMFEGVAVDKLNTMATNMGCNVKINADEGYYNVKSGYDGTANTCLDELSHVVDTSKFSKEGDKRDSKTSDTIASGDDTVPASDTVDSGSDTVSGGTSQRQALRLNPGGIQLMSSNGSSSNDDNVHIYTTIEDTLIEMNEYYEGNIFDSVFKTEQYIDGLLGTNSAQYAYTNRKKRTSNGGGGGGGNSQVIIEPDDILTKDQMVDRFVKRMIAQNNIRQLDAADQAVRYACSAELQAEIESEPTAEEIDAQRAVANSIQQNDEGQTARELG